MEKNEQIVKVDPKELAKANVSAYKLLKQFKQEGKFKQIINEQSDIDLDDVIGVLESDEDQRIPLMEETLKKVFKNPDDLDDLMKTVTQCGKFTLFQVLTGSVEPTTNQLVTTILRLYRILN